MQTELTFLLSCLASHPLTGVLSSELWHSSPCLPCFTTSEAPFAPFRRVETYFRCQSSNLNKRRHQRFRQQPRRPATAPGNRRRPCPNYGDAVVSHTLEECRLKDLICDKCKKKGHKERNCSRKHTFQKPRSFFKQQHHQRAAVAMCDNGLQSAINQTIIYFLRGR